MHLAERMSRMSGIGYAGKAPACVNRRDEEPCFAATVLPLLWQAGLRQP